MLNSLGGNQKGMDNLLILQQLSKRLTFLDEHASAIIERQLHG